MTSAYSVDHLTTSLLQELLNIVQQQSVGQIKNLSLLNGLAGQLLFQWYAAKSDCIEFNQESFQTQLSWLTESVSELSQTINFGYGIAGAGWLLELFVDERTDGYDPELNQDVEDLLTAYVSANQEWHDEIEYVLGLSGLAVFAARRMRNNSGSDLYKAIVNILEKKAIYHSADLCSWQVPSYSVYRFNQNEPEEPEHNLGLAHGVPAIIAALIPAITLPDIGDRATKLVTNACNWLVAQALADKTAISCFSTCVGLKQSSRLAWCYGDLTIALTLARAGLALNRADLIRFAHQTALLAAKRTKETAMVRDAGFCHGSAGLMLIFQLMHQLFDDLEFKKASDYWFADLIELYKTRGIEGFYAYRPEGFVQELGLLEGFSGIGLCLLARQGIAPRWADSLLLA